MSHTVYGLRLNGERETRYIGVTRHPLEYRLRQHTYRGAGMFEKTPFAQWLLDNRGNVEAFKIAEHDDHYAARDIERVLIAFALRMDQRLFNSVHVPVRLRLVGAA